MQEYVQKSTSTTFPLRSAAVKGRELSQSTAPSSDGRSPSTGKPIEEPLPASETCPAAFGEGEGPSRATRRSSREEVRARERRVRKPVSTPRAIAATATRTPAPSARRSHSLA